MREGLRLGFSILPQAAGEIFARLKIICLQYVRRSDGEGISSRLSVSGSAGLEAPLSTLRRRQSPSVYFGDLSLEDYLHSSAKQGNSLYSIIFYICAKNHNSKKNMFPCDLWGKPQGNKRMVFLYVRRWPRVIKKYHILFYRSHLYGSLKNYQW